MFAGIVEEMGAVKSLEKTLAGTRLTILASAVMDDLPIGASIGVNGACLTVVKRDDKEFTVDVSPETLGVTNLGSLSTGSPVNLERAMKLNERIGGHLVAGPVTRYEAPGLDAVNFLCEAALAGGVAGSLRNDPWGKGFAQILLSMPVRVPGKPIFDKLRVNIVCSFQTGVASVKIILGNGAP